MNQFHELRERLLRAGIAPRHVRRYLNELADHWKDLAAEETRNGHADAEARALARLGSLENLAEAMIEQRSLHSWSSRAPWIACWFAPLFALAGSYLLACLILWTGWKLFLPGTETPFVPVSGYAVLYFGVGRMLYFAAPVLVGWGIGFMATRQRLRMLWPMAGMGLIAWVGGLAHIHASQAAHSTGGEVVGMSWVLGNSMQEISTSLLHALMILVLTGLPYCVARLQRKSAW